MGQILNNWNMGNRWNGPDKHNFFWSPAKKRLCYILVMHWQTEKQCWWSGFWLVLLWERSWVHFPWPSKISKYFWSRAHRCHVNVMGPSRPRHQRWDPHSHVISGGAHMWDPHSHAGSSGAHLPRQQKQAHMWDPPATSAVMEPTRGTRTATSAVVGHTCGTHLPCQQQWANKCGT